MSYNVIGITREQQRDLHNARCYFEQWLQRYEDVLGQIVIDDFKKAYKLLAVAHDPIREQEDARWENRNNHYEAMRQYFKFKTIWSDYSIERLDEELPPERLDITHVKYYNQLVAVESRPEIGRLDWLAVWAAADKAIIGSGDSHHIFVEGIRKNVNDPEGVYELNVGS